MSAPERWTWCAQKGAGQPARRCPRGDAGGVVGTWATTVRHAAELSLWSSSLSLVKMRSPTPRNASSSTHHGPQR